MKSTTDGRALLAQFIEKRTTRKDFARAVGCSQSHLSLILSGERAVSLSLAKRICEATDGKVPIELLPHEAA